MSTIASVVLDPPFVVLLATLTAIIGVHQVVESLPNKKDTALLVALNRASNSLYSLFSLLSLVAALWATYLDHLTPPRTIPLDELLYCADVRASRTTPVLAVYFWAKLWEGLVDMTLVTLRGIPVHIHFRLHHYTTPIFAWLGLHTGSAHGFTFMVLNLIMHIMVYAYHGGFRYTIIFRSIRFWQSIQLFGGTIVCLLALMQRATSEPCTTTDGALGWASDSVPALLFLMYYQLFLIEIRDFESGKFQKKS